MGSTAYIRNWIGSIRDLADERHACLGSDILDHRLRTLGPSNSEQCPRFPTIRISNSRRCAHRIRRPTTAKVNRTTGPNLQKTPCKSSVSSALAEPKRTLASSHNAEHPSFSRVRLIVHLCGGKCIEHALRFMKLS